jgi:hypothetical protein
MDDAAKRLIYERNGAGTQRRGPRGSLGSSSDPEGRRIIVERNARARGPSHLGRASLSPDDAQLLAGMRTNRQGRAVLGAVAQTLRVAYEQRLPFYSQIGAAGKQLAAAMQSRLDGINNYAQRVYAGVPDDDSPISSLNQQKIALTLAQARDAANDIDETVRSQHLHVSDVVEGAAGLLTEILTSLVKAALRGVGGAILPTGNFPGWVKIAVGGAAVLLVVGVTVKLLRTIVQQTTPLGEAEEAAVAIMESKRRKRRVLSIS